MWIKIRQCLLCRCTQCDVVQIFHHVNWFDAVQLRDGKFAIELEQVKSKLEKVERERNDLKLHTNSLENKLAEVSADLDEEATSSSHATEILEVETAERMRMEKDLSELSAKYSAVKQRNEKMELELIQLRLWQTSAQADLSDDEVDGEDSIYRERYTKVLREMNFMKKQLEQQHAENLDDEKVNRKNVERKWHDAQEEAETLRRNLQQEKKKSIKCSTEMQDMKLQLEDQIKRNNELEKKQKRFDSEMHKCHDDLRQERILREKLQREKDELTSEQLTLDNDLQRCKLDLQAEREKVSAVESELREVLMSGSKGGHEVVAMRRAKQELENKVKEMEEELDDQAAQIEQLEQTKLRHEMQQEKWRQQHMKELEEKEAEIEEMRFNTHKKVKKLESQLEEEYVERQHLQREKRDAEVRIKELANTAPITDKASEKRLRKDLHMTKALLRDAEVMLQKGIRSESSQSNIRQLRNQLEDVQFSFNAASKAKKSLESEMRDVQQQLENVSKQKQLADDKYLALMKEKSEAQSRLEENDEDMNELMKKYKNLVQQQSLDHGVMTEQLQQIEDLYKERDLLREQVSNLMTKLHNNEETMIDKHMSARVDVKMKETEMKLEYELSLRQRLEVQLSRTKEQFDRLTRQNDETNGARLQAEETEKKLQRIIRDGKDELVELRRRELETSQRRADLERKVEQLHGDYEMNRSDLKLAFKRIADLQAALEAEIESDDSLLMDSDDELDSASEEEMLSYRRASGRGHNRSLGSAGSSSRSHANSSFTDIGIIIESPPASLADGPSLYLEDTTCVSADR